MKIVPWFGQGPELRLAYAVQTGGGQSQSPSLNALFTSSGGSDEPKRTVRAGRRRPSGPANEPRERADAPQRERRRVGGGQCCRNKGRGGEG